MRLSIAGIIHSDPLGRARLATWLRTAAAQHPSPPELVAVEWDQTMLAKVVVQRPILKALARKEWPDAPEFFLDALSQALGYEGDTHVDVFPGTRTLWLDQGRDLPYDDAVSSFAVDRMANYRNMYFGSLDRAPQDQLESMSHLAWASSTCSHPSDRDAPFADAISREASTNAGTWGIVIVGACHSKMNDGFMAARLAQFGLECNVFELRPST